MTAPGPAAGAQPGGGTGQADGAGWGVDAVEVRYGQRVALEQVSFQVLPGVVSAVVGGDGSGRTTLLRCLAGAITPDSGRVRRPQAARIGYLPEGSGTYPDLSVRENLDFRASAYGVPAAEARSRAEDYLERAGLAGAADRLAGQLSGGMRQKLGVIATLLHRPDLLVLDEPTTGVDPVSRADLWWLIASAAAGGAAVVLATSYLDEAERAASVLALDAGRPLAMGTPEEIVAAMPGTLREAGERPDGPAAGRAWRRGGRWRIWEPPGDGTQAGAGTAASAGTGEGRLRPDLQDAVVVAALAREMRAGAPDRDGDLPAPARGAETGTGRPLAECVHVSRRFGSFVAVDGVDLQLAPGEVLGLLGANGAGKTTLIRMLLGLLPASEGQVRLFGEPPSRGTRRQIGYVPQGLGLYEDLTPAENLEFAAAVFGSQPVQPRPPARTLVGALPLGVQRSLAFTEALAHRPGLLVLDEPTSGVDPLARARLWETVTAAARAGTGVLITTHYLDEASECDRLVVMAGGRVVATGTAAEIIGGAQVTVVEARPWAPAFSALEAAGLPVALTGRVLRVPGASAAEVRGALGDVTATVSTAPATLEERFFELTLGGHPRESAR